MFKTANNGSVQNELQRLHFLVNIGLDARLTFFYSWFSIFVIFNIQFRKIENFFYKIKLKRTFLQYQGEMWPRRCYFNA